MQKALRQFDFSTTLIWDSPECMEQFKALIDNPPRHSVVAHIDPVMAAAILKSANTRNRPLSGASVENLVTAHNEGEFALTGDTIKLSAKGRLLDGQYRLTACVKANKGFETHIVFGLDEKVFDILDRQRTRTPGDILAICGVKDYTIVAGAIRWVLQMGEHRRGTTGRGMSPRRIRELATGSMREVAQYARSAEQIRGAYKIPPTMAAALLFLIGKGNKAIVDSFVQDWLGGNRNYARNKNFDVLASRIATVRAQNNGHLNRTMLAAMMVQTFNHWNAGVAAVPRALTWKKEWVFPALAFDKDAFVKERDRAQMSSSALSDTQVRVLRALHQAMDGDGNAQLAYPDLGKRAGVPPRQISYIMATLRADNAVHMSKKATHNMPAIWRLKDAGIKLIEAAA